MTTPRLLSPQVDFVFKNIFSNTKHPSVLISLLNSILGYTDKNSKKIIKATIESPEITKEMIDDRNSVLDIKATINDGEIINIEMQIKNEHNIIPRSMYYLGKIFSNQLKPGEFFGTLKRCVVICILGYNLFNDNDNDNNKTVHKKQSHPMTIDNMHNIFRFMNVKSHEELSSLMEIHYIELPKLLKVLQNNTSEEDTLLNWLLFLVNPESEAISMAKEKTPEISYAAKILEALSRDKKARQLYEMREMSRLIAGTNLEAAMERGLKQGIEKGMEKGREEGAKNTQIQIAKKLLKSKKYTLKDITEISGLSMSEIKTIK